MIQFKEVFIDYENTEIIKNFSCTMQEGKKYVFSGVSGSGKSTLLNALMGFVPISKGEIVVNDKKVEAKNIHKIRSEISWLPQNLNFDNRSCRELAYYVFEFGLNKTLKPSENEMINMLNMLLLPTDILDKTTDEISGGQKQRLMLASVLLLKKPILILDEPTSALDKTSTEQILNYIKSQNVTLISASHDAFWNQNMDTVIEVGK